MRKISLNKLTDSHNQEHGVLKIGMNSMEPTGSYVLNPSAPRKGSNRFRTWTKLESAEDVEESSAISPTFGSCFVGWSSSLSKMAGRIVMQVIILLPSLRPRENAARDEVIQPAAVPSLGLLPRGEGCFPAILPDVWTFKGWRRSCSLERVHRASSVNAMANGIITADELS